MFAVLDGREPKNQSCSRQVLIKKYTLKKSYFLEIN